MEVWTGSRPPTPLRAVRGVSVADIWAARRRLRPFGEPTPTVVLPGGAGRGGAPTLLKLETVSPVGSFKWRGALNKMLSLPSDVLRRGVTTFSTGNHGIAVAYAARELGVPAFVCLPATVARTKLDRLRALGAGVDLKAATQEEAAQRCRELQAEHGLTIVEPFDDPDVIAGQGTIGLELLDQHPDLEAVVVPVSGGGLVSGIAAAMKANSPATRVIGVGAAKAGSMFASVQAGRVLEVAEGETVADSLLGGLGSDNHYTFEMVCRLGVEVLQVEETAIVEAMVHLLRRVGLAVEGAAAVGLAALLGGQVEASGPLAVVVTGRNMDIGEVQGFPVLPSQEVAGRAGSIGR